MQPLFIYSISAARRRAALGGDGGSLVHLHGATRTHPVVATAAATLSTLSCVMQPEVTPRCRTSSMLA